MTDRELMQKALEALQYASEETKPENLHGCDCLICKTILALRDRLSQPKTPEVTPDVTPHVIDCPRCGHCCPQWVGLTDEEIKSLPSWWPSYEDTPALVQLVKDVEAKLREKNEIRNP